jgi:opacity protein-like surface antigen
MKRKLFAAALVVMACACAAVAQTPQTPQDKEATRVATREHLRQVLAASGPKVGIAFRQSDKNPFNFVAVKRDGLVNSEALEIVIEVSDQDTIHFRIYPHVKSGYINLNKAKDSYGLARTLLHMSNTNFIYWGADETDDVFAGYNFTLESGFPDKAIEVVLYSIAPLDGYVGQMRPFVDGGPTP